MLVLGQSAFVHEPFESYTKQTRHGFTIYVSAAAAKQSSTTVPAIAEIERQLKEITEMIPAEPLAVLRKIPIFVEHNNPGFPCACYHPGADWLRENGYIVAKENAVEIANPGNFVEWVKQQPYMVLHELAHGYHDLQFTYEDPTIASAWKHATEKGFYDKVRRYNGRIERHYALTNPMEYFAEATEAYFGKNDFFPFVRSELLATDPKGYEMIKWAWKVRG